MPLRIFLLLLFLAACAPQKNAVDEMPEILSVYSSSTTEAWIPLVYTCAERPPFRLVARNHSIASADMSLRLIAPQDSALTAYQVGEVEIVVAGNAINPIPALTQAQVAAIFDGRISNWAQVGGEDGEIRLWVYGQEDDLQQIFNETLLGGGKLSSLARQAQNTEEMRREIAQDAYALGIISQAEGEENLRILYNVGKFPVFTVLQEEMGEELFSLLKCLQEG